MSTTLDGNKIAFLVAPEGVEQVELTEPWKAVEQAGGTPELVSTEVGKIPFNHLTPADTFEADKSAGSVSASDYAGLVLPGGVANRTSCAPTPRQSHSPRASSTAASRSR